MDMEAVFYIIWRNFKLLLGAATALLIGSVAFVHNGIGYLQDAQVNARSYATDGIVVDRFITYRESNDDTFPVFNVTYSFEADGATRYGQQEVNREFYESVAEGGPIKVYVERDNFARNYVDFEGKSSARRWGIILGGLALLFGGAVLIYYGRQILQTRHIIKPKLTHLGM